MKLEFQTGTKCFGGLNSRMHLFLNERLYIDANSPNLSFSVRGPRRVVKLEKPAIPKQSVNVYRFQHMP